MKRIKFENLSKTLNVAFLLLSAALIIIGTFELFGDSNPKLNKYSMALGFSLQAIYFSRMFWYKNYVQWNKVGATIRSKSLIGKSISFNEIKNVELETDFLMVTKHNGKVLKIDIQDIEKSDVEKLNNLLSNQITLYE